MTNQKPTTAGTETDPKTGATGALAQASTPVPTLYVDGKPLSGTFDFNNGASGVTFQGYDENGYLLFSCKKGQKNETPYRRNKPALTKLRTDHKSINNFAQTTHNAGNRAITWDINKFAKDLKLSQTQIDEFKKSGILNLSQAQFDALKAHAGQMHIMDGGKQTTKPKGKTEPAPVTSPVPQAEVDAAKAEQKDGWAKFGDHMKAHWWKYLLALITIGVIGYFGFRKGGWWNKKSSKTPATTPPTVPGGLEGNGGSKPDSNSNDISSLTQGALLGMTKVDAPAMSDNGEVIGRGGIPTRTY